MNQYDDSLNHQIGGVRQVVPKLKFSENSCIIGYIVVSQECKGNFVLSKNLPQTLNSSLLERFSRRENIFIQVDFGQLVQLQHSDPHYLFVQLYYYFRTFSEFDPFSILVCKLRSFLDTRTALIRLKVTQSDNQRQR